MANDWASAEQFWITLAVALTTIMATVINYLLFRSQVHPMVVVYVMADEGRPSMIVLVIENIGKGVAKDVNFTLSSPMRAKAFGWDKAWRANVSSCVSH